MEQLKRHFKTRVALRQTGRGGRLEISYSNMEDLTRIVEIIKA
jgi:ParB family chromosome partitioning protein